VLSSHHAHTKRGRERHADPLANSFIDLASQRHSPHFSYLREVRFHRDMVFLPTMFIWFPCKNP